MNEMDPQAAANALAILRKRDSLPTDVRLSDGRSVRVLNVAWGRDLGDEFDHVTTNVSPSLDSEDTIDIFYTSEIEALSDPESGTQIYP